MRLLLLAAACLLVLGCGAIPALAGTSDLVGVIGDVKNFAAAKVEEVQSRSQLYAAGAALMGTVGAVALRWADHKVKGKKA